jgi:adenylate kinase family enzyme
MGRSGCGKGTQAKLLMDYLQTASNRKITYVETGERFRSFIKEQGHSSELSREIAETGGLQPEFLAVWNWASLFVESVSGDEHLILDGMPRRIREAHVLDSAMGFYKRMMPLVIHIQTSKEWSKNRMMERKRADDTEEDIERRLGWFDTEVTPIFEFYERDRNYNYIVINGEQSVEEVHNELITYFRKLYGNHI